jgi:acyl-CoA synthetase (AMP-forming)/AMP-acid ligase II/1-acyl-sn-glycerol-3-phosphate acyltransferase
MLSAILKRLLGLRYAITVDGLERIDHTRGVLVLPNHPAEIDPVIVTTYLWDLLHPRPVVIEGMYHLPFLNPVLKKIRAIPMADMEFDSGPYKRRRIARTLDSIVSALRQGDNILFYPSGRLSVTGVERLGGASGVHSILQSHPNANVVLVRIRGLYGSIFSKAPTGGITPDVATTILRGLSILARNALFFTPRRPVSIEISCNPPDFPRDGDALAINKYLERVYNAPEPEAPVLVSHSRWSHAVPQIPEIASLSGSIEDIPESVRSKILAYVAHVARVPVESLSADTQLGDDLAIDSLSMAEILTWLDREFEVHDVELAELITVGSLMRAASGQLRSSLPKPEYRPPSLWSRNGADRPQPELRSATTIAQAFLMSCARLGSHPAIGDPRSGVLSWDEIKFRVVLLARFMATLPESHIGVLLPASVASATVSMAAILAGKVPVFLNWTAGKRSLEHACAATALGSIFTAESFLDIIPVDLEFLEDRFILLERIKKDLSIRETIAAKRLARESTDQILEAFGQHSLDPQRTAVVLFTSGSEALPKGVPLSHHNILSNVRGVLEAFEISSDDILLGFLPPFHSFGLTICTLLPLMTGLRVAYHPNPNESRKIAKSIKSWGATIAAGTPTFLRAILQSSPADHFQSVRALVSGAERAPDSLFELAASINPNLQILEGYGITECSPVVSVGRPTEKKVGVGRPLSGVTLAIVHPETLQTVPHGDQGLVLIRGPNVFSGYLDPSLNPFLQHDGERWYNSGDLGRIEDGRLVITGRLKRFIKIAGEMVSLGAIEDSLQKLAPSPDGAPSVAVLTKGTEGDGRPKLFAFVAGKLSVEAANSHLKEAGFPHIVHISEVREIQNLPVLGSGKTDYQSLQTTLT